MAYLNRLMDVSSILSCRSDLPNGISGKPDHDITPEEQCTEALLKMAIVAKGNKANCIYVASCICVNFILKLFMFKERNALKLLIQI